MADPELASRQLGDQPEGVVDARLRPAADVEHAPLDARRPGGDAQPGDHVADEREVAGLLAVAEHLDRAVVERGTTESVERHVRSLAGP